MASDYDIPPLGTSGDRLLGFLLENVQEADGWLQAQRPTTEWERVLEMLGPSSPAMDVQGLSNCGYNLVERNARDIVASLSNFRYEGDFRPTFDKSLYDAAHTLTKVDHHWSTVTNAHEPFRANLQNTVAFGTGYLVQDWDKNFHGTYGDVRLRAFGPQDVTFVQLPKNHDIQKAYITFIREELPINLARYLYPNIADHLHADRDAPGWIQKGLRKVQQFLGGSPALRVAGMGQKQDKGSFPTVDIFHAYVMDRSLNETGSPITMGTLGTNWQYTVPSVGDAIDTGLRNPDTGQFWTRPATPADCRLFPLRRYCVFSRTAVAYDGSSPWWHGATPVVRTRFNDWAWEALGKSLLGDVRTMQDGIIALMRLIEDAGAARLNPPVLFDDRLVSEGFAKGFNTRLAGTIAAADINSGEVLKFPVPVEHYNVPDWLTEWVKSQEQRINHQMGTPDLVAMAKAKQVPGEGTLEKLMEMAGPLVDDMVRSQEMPYYQLGEWRKSLYFQFYTHGRFISITGPDGDVEEFEYMPDLILPRIPGEAVQARQDRMKRRMSEFTYHLDESSINERHRMQNKLALLQLKKAGVKISDWAIAKAWDIKNYGPTPEGTRTVMEEWIAEQHMNRELSEELQLGTGQVGPTAQRGRPPSYNAPPRLQTKDGGQRTTITTS